MTMKCDEMKDLFVEALYGELPVARMAEFNAHLAACGACSREFAGLKRTLDVMDRRTRVEPTGAEWEEFSTRLEKRLSGEGDHAGDRVRRLRPGGIPAWAYGVAAVLLVAVGIYMGRTLFNTLPGGPGAPVDTAVAGPAATTRPTAGEVNREALAYLERSRNLLLGLTNVDGNRMSPAGLDRSRKVSRELYDRGNTLAVALNRPSQQQLRQLVQGLQIILLQLSNMDAGTGTPVVEMVRKGVDSRSILLKINLEAIRSALNEDPFRPAEAGGRNSL
jgi:hypothetical protein